MPGSDSDYFSDDFVLDDSALALLDEEEQKFTLSTQTQLLAISAPPAAPPLKRQKTETGWKPSGLDIRRTETMDDMDDLPEISVHGDGLYSLHARHAAAHPGPANSQSGVSRAIAPMQQSVQAPSAVQRRTVSSSSSGGPSSQTRHAAYNRPPTQQRLPSNPGTSRTFSRTLSANNSAPSQPPPRPVSNTHIGTESSAVETLRLQIEEVSTVALV